ncbi:MAG TPA: hypothetical protein PLQ52_08865 [Lacunisphaera sp.]|jgi:chromate transport protein ChrA|nr:hypothetical protein [Lacunisphaera sp.]HQY06161.1 hypothetical protein [Lacunisphaera sp.]
MSATFDYFMQSLGLILVASPTLGFAAWRVWKNRKMRAQGLPLRRRLLQSLLSVVLALVGCVAIGFTSRAFETSSTVGWLISLSMFAAYCWYFLVAALLCSIPILSIWVICLSILEPKKADPVGTDNDRAAPGRV